MKSLNYLSKMILFGLLLSTIPVVFIGFFSYITSSNEIQNHVNRGKMQLLMQTNANVEQILTTVNHTLNQVVNSVVLKEAINREITVKDFMLYNDLRNELRHMQSFDTKLEDVIVVNLAHNWMVKNSGIYRLDEYAYNEEIASLINHPDEISWILSPSKWYYSEESASNVVCNYTISLIKKLPVNSLTKTDLSLLIFPHAAFRNFSNSKRRAIPNYSSWMISSASCCMPIISSSASICRRSARSHPNSSRVLRASSQLNTTASLIPSSITNRTLTTGSMSRRSISRA